MLRRATPEDAAIVKRVRLSALADAPSAYATTYEEAAAFDDGVWRERLLPERHPTFLWEDADGAHGMVVGLFHDDDPTLVTLAAMWVSPAHRGAGAADELVAAVLGWARARGSTVVRLLVTNGNRAAERLYARHGFGRAGRSIERARDGLVEFEMEARLDRSAGEGA